MEEEREEGTEDGGVGEDGSVFEKELLQGWGDGHVHWTGKRFLEGVAAAAAAATLAVAACGIAGTAGVCLPLRAAPLRACCSRCTSAHSNSSRSMNWWLTKCLSYHSQAIRSCSAIASPAVAL